MCKGNVLVLRIRRFLNGLRPDRATFNNPLGDFDERGQGLQAGRVDVVNNHLARYPVIDVTGYGVAEVGQVPVGPAGIALATSRNQVRFTVAAAVIAAYQMVKG